MDSLAYTAGEIFRKHRLSNGLMNEERTRSASNHSAQSTNLETNQENDTRHKDETLEIM